jgi:signal transduction histidine kinase
VGGEVVITVDDAGPGVAPEDRQRIFERFVTVRRSRRAGTGTGIGLALVAETVAAHGGRVECVDRPGGGARFIVKMPLRTPNKMGLVGGMMADWLVLLLCRM